MTETTIRHLIVLGTVTLILAAGFCLLDGDDRGPDFCASALAVTLTVLLAAPLGLTGRLVPAPAESYHGAPSDQTVPPPRP